MWWRDGHGPPVIRWNETAHTYAVAEHHPLNVLTDACDHVPLNRRDLTWRLNYQA